MSDRDISLQASLWVCKTILSECILKSDRAISQNDYRSDRPAVSLNVYTELFL